MKTGTQIKDRALQLLNYTDQDGEIYASLYGNLIKRSLPVFNQVYAELWYMCNTSDFVPLESLTEIVNLPSRVRENVLPYGVAMMFAQTVGDADNQAMFANLYNQRRSSVNNEAGRRVDELPRGSW